MGSSKKNNRGSVLGSFFFWILIVPWGINTFTSFHIGFKDGTLSFSTNKDAIVIKDNGMDDTGVQDDTPVEVVNDRRTTKQLQEDIKEQVLEKYHNMLEVIDKKLTVADAESEVVKEESTVNNGDIGPQTEEF